MASRKVDDEGGGTYNNEAGESLRAEVLQLVL